MVNLIQPAEVKATVIAGLERLCLRNAPLHKGIPLVLAAPRFIGGDADIVDRAQLAFKPVDLLGDEVRFELPGTPADADTRPAVAIGRDAQLCPVFQTAGLLLGFVEHQVFKALGMPQRGDMDAAFPEKMLVQFGEVFIHFRELHAGVCRQHHVDGHIPFDHQKQHGGTVLTTGQADGVKLLAVCVLNGFPHGEVAPFSLLSRLTAHRWAARVRSRGRTGRQARPPNPPNPAKSRCPSSRCPCRRGTR